MLSGDRHGEELVSPAFCPKQHNLRTVSSARPASFLSGAQQKMVDTGGCSPVLAPPFTQSQQLTHASNSLSQLSHGPQALLPQQHSQAGLSPNCTVNRSDISQLRQTNPLLLQLLTTDPDNAVPVLHWPKTAPRSTIETSVSMSTSIRKPSICKHNQIINLIEKKLAIFRAQMKVLKAGSSIVKDSLTTESTSSCSPGPAPGMSTNKELKGCFLEDSGKNEALDRCSQSPKRSAMNKDTATAMQPTEYVGIMKEAAAICAKKEGQSQVVLQALGSYPTVDELVKQRPMLTQHYKPCNEDFKSTWRNVEPSDLSKPSPASSALETSGRDTCPVVENTRDIQLQSPVNSAAIRTYLCQNSNLSTELADKSTWRNVEPSDLSKSTPALSVLETSSRGTCLVAETTRNHLLQSPADSEDARMRLCQNSNLRIDLTEKSSGPRGNVNNKRNHQEFMAEVQDWVGNKGVFQRMRDRLKLDYEDITDDEEANATQQVPTLNTSLKNRDICEDHLRLQPSGLLVHVAFVENADIKLSTSQPSTSSMSTLFEQSKENEGPIARKGSIEVETSRPHEQDSILQSNNITNAKMEQTVTPSPKLQLLCVCPYYVQNDDDEVEQQPCPKCVQDASLSRKEVPSMGQKDGPEGFGLASGSSQHSSVMDPPFEEDDWDIFEVIASDVTHEILISDDDDDHEKGSTNNNIEPPNQSSENSFPKIQEFDSIISFAQQYNCKVPPGFMDAALSESLPASCSLPNPDAVETFVPDPVSEPGLSSTVDAEDSCDTDDSSDYPSITKRNKLTASSRARAPFVLSSSDSEDEGEMHQLPETITARHPLESASNANNFFPVMSADEDEDSMNDEVHDTTVTSVVTPSFSKETSPISCKSMKRHKTRAKRFKSSVNSDSDELNQESNLIHMENSLDSGMVSILPSQPAQKPGHFQPRPAQICQNASVPSNISSKVCSTHNVKGKSQTSTSDQKRKDLGKRKKSSFSLASSAPQNRADNGRVNCSGNLQNANTNVSGTKKINSVARLPCQPLQSQHSSTQSNVAFSRTPSVSGTSCLTTLSLNGAKNQASSLSGGYKQSEPQKPLTSKPNQVMSYDTSKSTPAKQKVSTQWEVEYIGTASKAKDLQRKRRRSSNDRDRGSRNTVSKATNRRDREPREYGQQSSRQRNLSHATPLMKRSMDEAKEYRHHANHQAPSELNPDSRSNGYENYKWAPSKTTAPNDFDWERERDSPELPRGLTEY